MVEIGSATRSQNNEARSVLNAPRFFLDDKQMRMISFDDLSFVPAGHEDPASPGVLKKVLFQRDELRLGAIQMVNWAKLLVGRSFAAHYHEDMQEIFVMMIGTARLTVGDQTIIMRPGDAVLIEPGETHQMWNEGDLDAEYLAIGIAGDANGQTVIVESE